MSLVHSLTCSTRLVATTYACIPSITFLKQDCMAYNNHTWLVPSVANTSSSFLLTLSLYLLEFGLGLGPMVDDRSRTRVHSPLGSASCLSVYLAGQRRSVHQEFRTHDSHQSLLVLISSTRGRYVLIVLSAGTVDDLGCYTWALISVTKLMD